MMIRRLVLSGAALLLAVLLLCRFVQLEVLARTAAHGDPLWITLALALQVLTLWNQPALYAALYAALDQNVAWRRLAPIVWAGHFVNVVTAGLGGTALLLDDARRSGLDVGRVALANTLYFLLNFLWFLLLLGAGLLWLFFKGELKPSEMSAAALLLLGVVIAIIALYLAISRPQAFAAWLARRVGNFNRARQWLRCAPLESAPLENFVFNFARAWGTLHRAPRRWVAPCVHVMLVDVLEIAVLGACFAAFGVWISVPVLIAAYGIGTLFLVISITPQGLGVVEGVMTAVFVSLGVPLEQAAVAVLVYRGLSFWLPFFSGFFALRRVESFNSSAFTKPSLPLT